MYTTKKKYIFFVFAAPLLSLIITIWGCCCNKTSPDILYDQQIVAPLNSQTSWSDCDTLFITCIDYRFAAANQEFINDTLKLRDNYDHISIPGSIYNLVNPETQGVLFSKFELSVRLHLIKQVIIISHIDCGGYGGSASFGSEIAERETLITDITNAREFLIEKYPTLEVKLYLESLINEGNSVKVIFEEIH